MTSSIAQAQNNKHILLNNVGSKQSGNEIWPVYVMLQSVNEIVFTCQVIQ